LLKQKGFTLIETIVAMTIASIFVSGMTVYYQHSQKILKSESIKGSSLSVRLNLQSLISDTSAWNMTSSKSSFNCTSGSSCPNSNVFPIYDGRDQLYYDSSNPAAGFSYSGEPCTTYPSATCPIRAHITFSPLCMTCNPKQINVNAIFSSSTNGEIFNAMSGHNFNMVKNIEGCGPNEFMHYGQCVRYPIFGWDTAAWVANVPQDANMWRIQGNQIVFYLNLISDPDGIVAGMQCWPVQLDVNGNMVQRLPRQNCSSGYAIPNASGILGYGDHNISAGLIDDRGVSVPFITSAGSTDIRRIIVYPIRLLP
jgi:prepilin-type N-terminal cleavage/methylation domain-containing protein